MADAISTSTEDSVEDKKKEAFYVPEKYRKPLVCGIGIVTLAVIAILVWIEISSRQSYLGHRTYEDGCRKAFFDGDTFDCLCDHLYCDKVAPVGRIERNEVVAYETSASDSRLRRILKRFQDSEPEYQHVVTVDVHNPKHDVVGFGSTLTESSYKALIANENITGIVLRQLLEGSTLLRVPIGADSTSSHKYSLAEDADDFSLHNFDIKKDKKLTLLSQIVGISSGIKLWAISEVLPDWITSKDSHGCSQVEGSVDDLYHNVYAQYLVKYLEEARRSNINYFAISPLSRPLTSFVNCSEGFKMASDDQRLFFDTVFGPSLKSTPPFKNVKIIGHDDSVETFPQNVNVLFLKNHSFVDGFSVLTNLSALNHSWTAAVEQVLRTHHERFVLSVQEWENIHYPQGSWFYAAKYASGLIESINGYSAGFLDPNLAVERQENILYKHMASVVIDPKHNQFYKQPLYYIQGHFRRFIPSGSKILNFSVSNTTGDNSNEPVELLAVLTPNFNVVLVLHNKVNEVHHVTVDASTHKTKRYLPVVLAPNSIQTLVWRAEAE